MFPARKFIYTYIFLISCAFCAAQNEEMGRIEFNTIEKKGFLLFASDLVGYIPGEIFFLDYKDDLKKKDNILDTFYKSLKKEPILTEIFFDVLNSAGMQDSTLEFKEIPSTEILVSVDGHPEKVYRIFYGSLFWGTTFAKEFGEVLDMVTYQGCISLQFQQKILKATYKPFEELYTLKGFSFFDNTGEKRSFFSNPNLIFKRN